MLGLIKYFFYYNYIIGGKNSKIESHIYTRPNPRNSYFSVYPKNRVVHFKISFVNSLNAELLFSCRPSNRRSISASHLWLDLLLLGLDGLQVAGELHEHGGLRDAQVDHLVRVLQDRDLLLHDRAAVEVVGHALQPLHQRLDQRRVLVLQRVQTLDHAARILQNIVLVHLTSGCARLVLLGN